MLAGNGRSHWRCHLYNCEPCWPWVQRASKHSPRCRLRVATRAMTRLGLLASLNASKHPEERDGNPTFLRDTVLQSQTTLHIDGWSKGNLLRSIAHLSNQIFSLFV